MNGDLAIRWLAMAICTVLAAAVLSAGLVLSAPDEPGDQVALQLASGEQLAPEPPVTTVTTIPTVTVAPATTVPPVTTRPRPVVTQPAPPPPPPAPAPKVVASTGELCAQARASAAAHGAVLPAGWGFRCPDAASSGDGVIHAGIACMNMPGTCPGSKYVGINVDVIGPRPAYVQYVVTHEICHAIELEATGATSEPAADACAAAHGAPRP